MAKKYQQKGSRISVDRDKPIADLRHSFMTISVKLISQKHRRSAMKLIMGTIESGCAGGTTVFYGQRSCRHLELVERTAIIQLVFFSLS